jgi:hypothetical protein
MIPRTVYAGVAGLAALILLGQAFAGPAEPHVIAPPAQTIIGHIEAVQDADGVWHDECAVYDRGQDSLVRCIDGYEEVS